MLLSSMYEIWKIDWLIFKYTEHVFALWLSGDWKWRGDPKWTPRIDWAEDCTQYIR